MWSLKYDANELIYETETDCRQRKDLWLPRQRGEGEEWTGVWGWQMETVTLKWINNKVLICSTENYFQYPVINYNGKEYKKECIDVFVSFCSVTEIGITL